jgi:hypothetical protein
MPHEPARVSDGLLLGPDLNAVGQARSRFGQGAGESRGGELWDRSHRATTLSVASEFASGLRCSDQPQSRQTHSPSPMSHQLWMPIRQSS